MNSRLLEWDDALEEQKVEIIEEFLHHKNVREIFNKLEDRIGNGNKDDYIINIVDQILVYLTDYWILDTSKVLIKPYTLNKKNTISIPNSISDTVCIVSIGSSFTLHIYKEFPEGSKTSVLFKSVLISAGTAIKIENTALQECEFIIPSKSKVETVYLVYYY